MITRTDLTTKTLAEFDIRHLPYETIEFAHDELKEMALRLRFGADCLPDDVPAQKQSRNNAEMLERRAADLLYEHCNHEFEWVVQPGSVNSPSERFHVCKNCGVENRDE